MALRESLRQVREKQYNLKLEILPENPEYELGKTYFCGYWNQSFKVIDFTPKTNDWRGWSVTVHWQDGQITNHCTSLDRDNDFLVVA